MFTQKLEQLAHAMAEFEGWGSGSGIASQGDRGTMSYRNHNPLNLKASPFALGIRDGHAFFLNDNVGMFAGMWDIWMKCQGRTSTALTANSTLDKLIRVWADADPSIQQRYLDHIYAKTGISQLTKLKNIISYGS